MPPPEPLPAAHTRVGHVLQQVVKQPCVPDVFPGLLPQCGSEDGPPRERFAVVHDLHQLQLSGLVPAEEKEGGCVGPLFRRCGLNYFLRLEGDVSYFQVILQNFSTQHKKCCC